MTDQSKIPLPPRDGSEPGAGGQEGHSLIERAERKAGGSVDLNRFLPPPIPLDGDPALPRSVAARRRRPTGDWTPPAVDRPVDRTRQEPKLDSGVQSPALARLPVSEPDPSQQAREPAEVPVPEPARPVHFAGDRHPVDRAHLREQGLILPEGNVTMLLEEFRIIKRQLMLQAADLRRQGGRSAAQRILVSSPHPGEGKTYCAVNLALSIAAEKESDVLLVDADFARPSLLRTLGLPEGPGLMDALEHPEVDVADLVMGTDIPGLWVLPPGHIVSSDAEYLSSSRTAQVLDRLTEGAPNRIVIFDSSPALVASPAAELARHVGQTVMVVRADQTGKGALEDAVSLLSACPNIELLLNAVHFSPSGRRFGSYGYGG